MLGKDVDPANRMQPGHAPTPFSAEEIRDASPSGHYSVFRVEGKGIEPFRLVSEFTEVDDENAAFLGWRETMEKQLNGDMMTASAKWTELQAHASFPENQTEITEESVTVPAGSWTCWIYSIKSGDGTVKEMAFAQDLPGPPIRMLIFKGEEVVYSMELVETGLREKK